jgi:O-acetyl-ADP-ribose deacetylase (regulator of RNase III)
MPSGSDLFKSNSAIIAIPVNCVPGVMGAGLAKVAALKFPYLRKVHESACRSKELKPGHCLLVKGHEDGDPMFAFLSTKDHWKEPSRIEWVDRSMYELAHTYFDWKTSCAVPALGCGLGGLSWSEVRPVIESRASERLDWSWLLYEPSVTPIVSR